jgi:ribosome-binding protein aMBF1 (putative translation factor)
VTAQKRKGVEKRTDMGYILYRMTRHEENAMTTRFEDFVREIEHASSDEERRELEAARARFRLGARLQQQRLAAGLTQKQLADASGVAQADISRIERGQGNPTAATLGALGGPLGVTLEYISAEQPTPA